MKLSANMTKELNDQIAMEADASNYYLSIASWCEVTGFDGATKFFYNHSDEERQHMLKIIHHMNDLGVPAVIPQIKKPSKDFKSLESVFKIALKNEQKVTASINKMVDLAQKQKDHSTFTFLQWFVNEQLQEEKTFETILQKFDLIGRDRLAINEIDKYLGTLSTASESQ
ncbi:MAG: ferritin [Nitrosopumilaceae archaeon]|nr:ferritin [Nitrosopumilaceae archaeon]NIU01760.1 ferritin [Nitrosopumilaceae archaeon]NIU88160.1 ferritin [Nitrosopumilaceae archaeon]NIV66483.1 ferritin [Nitrosopumilaceae archaeon]NIX62362.1 ferritin [Nitrosopumilaceae archaeon]